MKKIIITTLLGAVILITGAIVVANSQGGDNQDKDNQGNDTGSIPLTGRNYVGSGVPVYVPDGYVASNVFSSALVAPWDLAFGPDGDLYVAEFTGSRVSKISSDGSVSTYVEMPESFRGHAKSLAFSSSGDLYVLISGNGDVEFNGILKISADKTINVLASVGGVEQLAIGPSGDIFVAGTWAMEK
jgi:glucose/arabinose dehydrogenase